MEKITLNFEYFYGIYKDGVSTARKIAKKFPNDDSKYESVCDVYEIRLQRTCKQLLLEQISSNPDEKYFEQLFLENMEKEELVMLDILSEFCWEFRDKILPENYYKFFHRCLDILEKNGTDMVLNYIPAYVYERLIDAFSPSKMVATPIEMSNEMLVLFKRIISLPYNQRWLDVPACYSIHYKTSELLDNSQEVLDILVNFIITTQDWQFKNHFIGHIFMYFWEYGVCTEKEIKQLFDNAIEFLKIMEEGERKTYITGRIMSNFQYNGFCDENFNWLGEK
ncbi:hypothetical protein AD998_21395 [bacterium 336/3]|nr:hypothetical protein AD998_21395 [bacterium 336/3]